MRELLSLSLSLFCFFSTLSFFFGIVAGLVISGGGGGGGGPGAGMLSVLLGLGLLGLHSALLLVGIDPRVVRRNVERVGLATVLEPQAVAGLGAASASSHPRDPRRRPFRLLRLRVLEMGRARQRGRELLRRL